MTGDATTGAIESDLFNNATTNIASTNDITFSGKMIKEVKKDELKTVQDAFIAYLNNIVTAFNSATAGGELAKTKSEFITNFAKAQRAGSAFAIRKQAEQLYKIAKKNTTETSVATAVMSAITGDATIKVKADTEGNLSFDESLNAMYAEFPTAQGMPDGAMLLTCTEAGVFSYTTGNPGLEIGETKKVNMNNIMFPLPIVYFDNTPAKATDESNVNWQITTDTWNGAFSGTSWYDAVKASTMSIALQNNINYGVAALQTTVTCSRDNLEDNALSYEGNTSVNNIKVPDAGFPVKGLLIGGQPNQVGWQLVNETTASRDYVVYDNVMNGAVAKADDDALVNIYTLVFDNWKTGAQEPVNVAIELVNNSDKAFYGQDGIVEIGQKFYLIGQLALDNATNKGTFAWPTVTDPYKGRYPVKAYKEESGALVADDAAKRVFIQDFTTKANFKISSLRNAYVTIPDLRATKLELGLSVDLKWQPGLTFDVTID